MGKTKEKPMEEKKSPVYVAFDSDVMGNLAIIHSFESKGKTFDAKQFGDSYILHHEKELKAIYNKIVSGEIRVGIVNTIFNESTGYPRSDKFMKDFGYFPNYTMANKSKKMREAMELAEAYTKPYIYNGKEFPAPMKTIYNAYVDRLTPTSDAFAMAEASMEHWIFVTANEKDFTKNESDFDFKKQQKDKPVEERYNRNTRALGIIAINRERGYVSEVDEHNRYTVPGPMGFDSFAEKVVSGHFEGLTPKMEDELIKASEVMGD